MDGERGISMRRKLRIIAIISLVFVLCCAKVYVPQGSTFFEQRVVPRPPDAVYDAALETLLNMGAPILYKSEEEKTISTDFVYSGDFYWRNRYSITIKPHPQGSVIRCVIQAWENTSRSVVESRYSPTLPTWVDYNYVYSLIYKKLKPAVIGVLVENESVKGPPVKVVEILPNSPADTIGVKTGDIIVEVDSRQINYSFEFWEVMLSKKVGETTKLNIKRGKEVFELEIPVIASPDM